MIVRAFEVSGESNSQNPCQTVADLEKMLNHSNEQGETLEIQCFALSTSAPSRSRTYDLMIKSHLLYRLSYRGIADQRSYPAFGRVTRNRMGGNWIQADRKSIVRVVTPILAMPCELLR